MTVGVAGMTSGGSGDDKGGSGMKEYFISKSIYGNTWHRNKL